MNHVLLLDTNFH